MAKMSDSDWFDLIDGLIRRDDWDALREILGSNPSILIRRYAMEALFKAKPIQAMETLADVASGSEMGLNEEILQNLRGIPGERSLQTLARVLSSPNPLRRAYTVTLLATRPEPAALVILLRAARDPMKSVCRIAETALVGRVQRQPEQLAALPRESVAGIVSFVPLELAQQLIGPDHPTLVRAEAARRLATTAGVEAVATLMALSADSDPALARAAWEGLRMIKDLPATFLLPFLADRKDDVRRQGLEIFAKTCAAEGAPIIAGMLKDRCAAVRESAVRALYKIRGDGALDGIRRLLADPDTGVRRAVVHALGQSAAATDDLIGVAVSEEAELKTTAIKYLAQRGTFDRRIADHYLSFLAENSTDAQIPQDVIDAMAQIAKILGDAHESRALEGFAALCRTTSRRLRRTGIEAIMAFPAADRGDVLDSLADTPDRSMLSAIAIALAEAKDPRASLPLVRTYVECGGRAARRAHELLQIDENVKKVEFLIDLLGNKWASARRYGAIQLKQFDDERVIEPLLKAADDEDPEVQLAAIEALGRFAKTHSSVAERLIASCGQGDVTVRQAAVEALGEAQVEAAVPVLIKALHNVFLRPRAEEALRKVGGRQGYLAMKRLKRREQLFGNKNRRRTKEKKPMPA
jgi:HEAT repeat protein